MRNSYFITRRGRYARDSWTACEWRPYVCKRRNGCTQLARVSELPGIVRAVGIGITLVAAFATIFSDVLAKCALVVMMTGLAMYLVPWTAEHFGLVLMKVVGPGRP